MLNLSIWIEYSKLCPIRKTIHILFIQPSGPYCFRPQETQVTEFTLTPTMTRVTYAHLTEYQLTFSDADWVNLVVRVYEDKEDGEVEVNWMVGPIPSQ